MAPRRSTPAKARKAFRFVVIPAAAYLLVFCILSYPLITRFSTHFFADEGDGFTNVWNIWWIQKAVTELHQSPWRTTLLHFPQGTSLLGHTLNPFNGFLAIPLLKVFSLTQAFNICVLFAFVMGGLTAFWLAYYLSRSYAGGLAAGYVFTFCAYHFAHAAGHMQLVSLEWIPLFVLAWYVLMTRPSVRVGVGAALSLFLILLCDYYYFFYAVIAAVLVYGWKAVRTRNVLFGLGRASLAPFLGFIATTALTSGPLVASLISLNRRDPLAGAHPSSWFSLDLPALLIPGGRWRFAGWTRFYWSRLPGNINESSVQMGVALVLLLILVWVGRKRVKMESLRLWYVMIATFVVLSLGPVLQVWGKTLPWARLPYALFEAAVPPLKLSGVPVRMMIMPMLAAGIILAAGFKDVFGASKSRRAFVAVLLALMIFEFLPGPMPSTRVTPPAYVEALKNLPAGGGVIDRASNAPYALYYQILHGKPLAFGYIARVPRSVERTDARIEQLIAAREWGILGRSYHFRYIADSGPPLESTSRGILRPVFDDGKDRIYEILPGPYDSGGALAGASRR
jgi:hypothetical protein